MIILPVPMSFGSSGPTKRCYSLVCYSADGRPIHIKLYGRSGLGREAFAAAQSVLRPSAGLVWDTDDDREPIWSALLFSTLGIVVLCTFGFFAMFVADMADFLPNDYLTFSGWNIVWIRICLGLWPFIILAWLVRRSLVRPGP